MSLERLIKGTAGGADDMAQDSELQDLLARHLAFAVQPTRLVALLEGAKRRDLGGGLLLTALDTYRRLQTEITSGVSRQDTAAAELERRSVFYLQLLVHLFQSFGSALLEDDVDRVLQFVDFIVSGADDAGVDTQDSSALDQLSNMQDPVMRDDHDAEMLPTALNLLLSLLEQRKMLTPTAHPMLGVLAAKVERLRDSKSADVRALAQEVALVLTSRSQLTSSAAPAAKVDAGGREAYQDALRHLQDPILPVRAHGLKILSDLVAANSNGSGVDEALVPAIFDIFVEAIQDDESYLYLNALKGLAQMAVRWKSQVLVPLVCIYVSGAKTHADLERALQNGERLSQRETDKRLRIGEALVQVLQELGDVASANMAVIVDPILVAVRNTAFSATLRSSFISVLGTCAELMPSILAAGGQSAQMSDVCVDLITLESVRHAPAPAAQRVKAYVSGTDETGSKTTRPVDMDEENAMDEDHVARVQREADTGIDVNPKLPQLRRSALLLLAVLLRTTRHQLEEHHDAEEGISSAPAEPLTALRMPGGGSLPSVGASRGSQPSKQVTPLVPLSAVARIERVCAYVAQEDEDAIVRQQAQDCVTEAEALQVSFAQRG